MRPFTYEAYRQMLFDMQAAGYKFLWYREKVDPPCCFLRHDVDVDLEFCLKIAAIEAGLGISSTYCLMVRSNAYNLLSPESIAKVTTLMSLGHKIGLHFSCAAHSYEVQKHSATLRCRINEEAGILQSITDCDCELVSFHRPNPIVLLGQVTLTEPIPHAYSHKFMEESKYFADSGGWFRCGHPLDSVTFREKKSITLNCHPLWWSAEGRSPLYALKEVVARQREVVRQYLLANIVGV